MVAALAAVAAAVSGGWHVFAADGIRVRVPPGWDATSAPLTHVTSPSQVLAVASYRLPRSNRGDDGCEPKAALDRLPPGGAFLYGWEVGDPVVGRSLFPPRPRHFRLTGFARYECMGPSYLLRFRAAGRYFQVHVVLGPRATAATRAAAVRILDSFGARRR
jgi:hypothetical protein